MDEGHFSNNPANCQKIKMIDRPIRERVFFLGDHDFHQSSYKTTNAHRRPILIISLFQQSPPGQGYINETRHQTT
ncbi:hypothetical protein LENED_001809 [Lentinula edodes]|uniref:Uncharacterized protein n=1 Tax=Lentinula edodes TaxID=5353 RepID=A0A1Q3DZ88_LENED|nr:hypothetical protein LENED_001809 [Lentinula edodes]